ncbi:precorrin-6A/cobalt-precorrin-6A reductase [Corynebacterium uropygiale]|uniref:Precorrin-6A/cobalt-precorrin-6A reductase n=1 Tax=Corynebacterium uropygiale TaxID=1775911 RepID=A0A9X1QQP6_9CORY|nr:precorrin-6A/cobalt-precorrin-6A reductase [Corynebacterium uropygiale]MCF4006662.1 precorrin-6A/cobalt-precorrin-6A reductase [Corynebacterium uropygiale]
MRVLILGGSEPAHQLAHELVRRDWWVTTILPGPGRTPAGQVRIGDQGGAAGIARFIIEHGVEYVVDATPPFEERASILGAEAARATSTPFFLLAQAPWQPGPHDRWQSVTTLEGAVQPASRSFRHILLDFWDAPESASAFAEDRDNLYVLRTAVPRRGRAVHGRTPARFRIIGQAPDSVEGEKQLLRDNQIDGIVLRNTGDTRSEPTLDAARELAIPIILIDRPAPPGATLSCHAVPEILHALHAD